MEKITNFSSLISIIKSGTITEEDGYLVSKINPSNTDEQLIKGLLTSLGYLRAESALQSSESDISIYINRQSNSWQNGMCPIYLDSASFWQQNRLSKTLPENYYLIKEGVSSCDQVKTSLVYNFESVFSWKDIIQSIADHNQNNKSIFFMVDEKSYKTYEIPLGITFDELLQLSDDQTKNETASEFHKLLEVNDPHKKERISVIRSALTEILDVHSDDTCPLVEIINAHKSLLKKYDSLYDMYVKRFSINKILNELDEKGLEFTSKINEFISSSQTKAIAIPSALIAIGALAKASGFIESILIALGLLLIKNVTKTTNDVYRESFDFLDRRIKTAFKKYLKFDEGKDVKESAINIQEELEGKIVTAKNRLNTIDKYAKIMLIVGLAFLIMKYFSN